ncbi:nucleotide-binding universal stress UspA family protein [Prauserella shujinwangii]|uniref:Nucleotide-binding universal stress UspA family protein n=1 Tax=Prauserella shujinwangii TaxID=1453103 RepID=A0A2T0LPN2_9PSEU|nr:universal stress protein [Prauserella shujinwangii]PRX45209.1 nucleotide-binding universal stress UspA family protein [Prauserella shujinwangii]
MTTANQGNAPIVVGVDSTEASLRAVRWAANTAAKHRAPLHLVHAAGFPDLYVGSTMPPPEAFKEELRKQKWEALHEAKRVAEQVADIQVEARFETDPPIPYLIRASRGARMIVLGSSGRTGVIGTLIGSTTMALVSHAHSPVVSVRDDYEEIPAADDRPVVVGIDGSELSERAQAYAFDEASFRGVELVAVHTWSDADSEFAFSQTRMYYDWEPLRDTEERRLAERLAGWQEKYPDVHVRRVLVRDRPRHELLEWSKKAQLVVVGSHGRGGFRGMLLGSTSQALIHSAQCPVMVARPEHERE